jgi:ketosteroid isomerase-like protein
MVVGRRSDAASTQDRRSSFASGKVKATDKSFEDDWIFAITVRDGRLTSIREYVDTQALARAAGPERVDTQP